MNLHKKTKLHTGKQWSWKFQFTESYSGPSLSNHTIIQRTTTIQIRHKHDKHVLKLIRNCVSLLATSAVSVAAYAEVGVSVLQQIQSQIVLGSVTNQAIQVLQGPYITNTYGNGIQCQGATMNITPFLTGTGNIAVKRPFEHTIWIPCTTMSDLDDDDVLDNPGNFVL